MPEKPIESIVVPEREAEIWDDEKECYVLNAPSNFYVLISTGDRIFYKTRDRAKAQAQADIDFPPKGKYRIRSVNDQKGKSKLESGGLSCAGSTSRRGTGSWLKKTV